MEINALRELISGDGLREKFLEIYRDAAAPEEQKKRYLRTLDEFEKAFGEADVSIYSAPGRTEIGGNHTDHQHGEVLAASINRDAIAVVAKRDGGTVRLISDGYPMITVDSSDTAYRNNEEGTTTGLIRGVLAGTAERGYKTGGFDAWVTSSVLVGAGLSSSAAFETLVGTVVSGLYNEGRITATEIAMMGQMAENKYFGKPCGLMDQMACSVGSLVHIDFNDPGKPVTERLDLPAAADGYRLCITDTRGSHADLTPDYAAVPAEMCAVAEYFGKKVLREVPSEKVREAIPELRKKLGDRAVLRALHFYAENERVRKEAAAIKAGDMDAFLKEVRFSGDSSFKYLQNVYTNHDVAHQNVSLSLCVAEQALGGRGACRVHGGGFAGTMQAWVPEELVDEYRKAEDAVFGEGACAVLSIRGCGGVQMCG